MSIRSIRPEFWSSEDIARMDWTLHYDGPLPTRGVGSLAPAGAAWEYVYMLFNLGDDLLYVGRSWRPVDRFTKHRRRPWWPAVHGLVLIKINEAPPWDRGPRGGCGPNTEAFESAAIEQLRPACNVAGVPA